MGDKPISFRDENGNFVSAADVWNDIETINAGKNFSVFLNLKKRVLIGKSISF